MECEICRIGQPIIDPETGEGTKFYYKGIYRFVCEDCYIEFSEKIYNEFLEHQEHTEYSEYEYPDPENI